MSAFTAALFVTIAVFALAYYAANEIIRRVLVTGEILDDTAVRERPWQRLTRRLSGRLGRWLPKEFVGDIGRQIGRAGGLAGVTPAELVVYGLGIGVAALAFGIFVVMMSGWPVWPVLLTTLIGVALPFIWLRDRVKDRQLTILADLPFHLDLLTLCVEAGLDFTAGVAKMVERGKPGPLRDEFSTFLAELRVGKTRAEALESMSARVGLPQLTSFISALIQSDRLGSGLGKALRAQSEQLRVERFQRAEAAAGEAPVKMLVPLVIFIFPTIWIILAAPLIFEWVWGGGRF
jgi:tight adherence protein C